MILIDDTKFSCVECIRGHRSSSCRHHARPLLQVRSKGRPNVHANGNPNHRIAVFAEEIAPDHNEDEGTKSPTPPDANDIKCKQSPVIILKASPKQVIDLISGQIIGPYDESFSKPKSNQRPPPPIISSDSFINRSTCCSGGPNNNTNGNGVSKQSGCCCCNNNRKRNVNKSKILKNYIQKHLKSQVIANKDNITSNQVNIKFINEFKANEGTVVPSQSGLLPELPIQQKSQQQVQHLQQQQQQQSSQQQQVYDVVPIPSCSIPGSCCCDDTCACQGCVVHGHATISEANKFLPNDFNVDYLNDVNNFNHIADTNIILNSISNAVLNFTEQQQQQQQQHRHQHQVQASNPVVHTHTHQNGNSFNVATSSAQPYQFQSVSDSNTSIESESPVSMTCTCPPESCNCTNCETHGILNGYKLDEFFSTTIMDQKLLSIISDFPSEGFNEFTPANSVNIKVEEEDRILPTSKTLTNMSESDLATENCCTVKEEVKQEEIMANTNSCC